MNRLGANERKHVLFINADREYREGKAQNNLRPEDIEKITHVYRRQLEVPKYSRLVPIAELEAEEFNLNIRRYVDNSPPPEPHDVRAHLQGGIPVAEVDALQTYWSNYSGLRHELFSARKDGKYENFEEGIDGRDAIKRRIEEAAGVLQRAAQLHKRLNAWWSEHRPLLEALPVTGNVFELRRSFMDSIAEALVPLDFLDVHKVRGALASYTKRLEADLKSVAASGWGAELIPETDILQSQFPEVLAQLERDRARVLELNALFDAADDEEAEAEEESGVLPNAEVKRMKGELKEAKANWKDAGGRLKHMCKGFFDLMRDMGKPLPGTILRYTETLGSTEPDFQVPLRVLEDAYGASMKPEHPDHNEDPEHILIEGLHQVMEEGIAFRANALRLDAQLEQHKALEQERKDLKAGLKASEKRTEELVAAARAKIDEAGAKRLILERLRQILLSEYEAYVRQHRQACVAAVQNLWDKYHTTARTLVQDRDALAGQLNEYIVSLGYE